MHTHTHTHTHKKRARHGKGRSPYGYIVTIAYSMYPHTTDFSDTGKNTIYGRGVNPETPTCAGVFVLIATPSP